MLRLIKIPVLTCSLLFAVAQPLTAQTGNKTDTRATTGNKQNTNAGNNQDTKTNIGNDSDISGGTTNAHTKNDNPKTVKNSRHCAANEDFVKQGDHMVCVPRTTTDNGLPMGKEKNPQNPQ